MAQQPNRLSLSVKNVSLQQFFEEIETKSPYRFSYRDIVLENKKDVTLNITNQSIESVLDRVLPARGLQYTINGVSVMITGKLQQAAGNAVAKRITGVVLDAAGEPVIGANVVEKGT
ncbi:MAG: STN domain-containing protein, partial [Tannerella sp.]|nr:STN domain-containing protein [Tannerella sp.]